ncbi:hypothetical protein FACS1894219_10460 [Clostridia bacterium]|nr:hypothetical protein FACS1894219_10460 [Clostridia bacterium]
MVLFYAGHISGLNQLFSLKMHRHSEERCVLVCNDEAFFESNFSKIFITNGIFEKIIFVPLFRGDKGETINEIESIYESLYDKILIENAIELQMFDFAYVCDDINADFTVYLSIKRVKMVMVEMDSKKLDDYNRYSAIEAIGYGTEALTETYKKHDVMIGLQNPLFLRRIRFNDSSDEYLNFNNMFYDAVKLVDFDFDKETSETIKLLSENDVCLILTNSRGYNKDQSHLHDSKLSIIYLLLIDYYLPDTFTRFIIKEHPYNIKSLHECLNGVRMLDSSIPIEFYCSVDNCMISNAISVETTSTKKLQKHIKSDIHAGGLFFRSFRTIHALFFAFSLCNFISFTGKHHIFGVYEQYIANYAQNSGMGFDNYSPKGINPRILKDDIFTVIDVIPTEHRDDIVYALENTDDLTKVFFINSQKDFSELKLEEHGLAEFIVPFILTKTALDGSLCDESCDMLEDEELYFFCRNEEVREKSRSFIISKTLKYTKLEWTCCAVHKNPEGR